MGASQSTTVAGEGTTTKTIYIDENEVPEAYRRVGVSDEVIDAVSRATQRGPAKIVFDADPSPSKLSNDLLKERQENERLRDELKRLSHLQSRIVAAPAPKPAPVQAPIQPPSPPPVQLQERFIPPQKTEISREDIEEKKRAFEETVNRVKKQFFGYQRENVCADVEKKLMSCLASNKNTVLNCKPLQYDYDLCIANFRAQVLKEQHSSSQVNEHH